MRDAPRCAEIRRAAPRLAEMYRDALRCVEMRRDASRPAKMYRNTRRCFEIRRDASRPAEMYRDLSRYADMRLDAGCADMRWDAPRWVEMYRDAPRCAGVSMRWDLLGFPIRLVLVFNCRCLSSSSRDNTLDNYVSRLWLVHLSPRSLKFLLRTSEYQKVLSNNWLY